MSILTLEDAIEEKYLQPTRRKRTLSAGLEFELPIVNLDRQPVDFSVVHQVTDAFIARFQFDKILRDDHGDIYSALHSGTGDGLSFDCSFNTLEFSFGVECNLNVLYQRFVGYYSFLQEQFKANHHTLTGMGINPHYQINRNEPIQSERYRMLLHHLSSYPKYGNALPFHHNPNFGLFSCASQVQLDVEESAVPEVLNTFGKLEPLKSILFANSPWGEHYELLCSRDHFWKHSLHGLNPHNVDMYEVTFHSPQEVAAYIRSTSLYCVERDGKYINFPPIPLPDYFASGEITGEYYDGSTYRKITFTPELEDLAYLRTFKFEDLTYRGTVEFRSVCEQPIRQIMAPAAFHAGLMENLSPLTRLLEADTVIYRHGYSAAELRTLFNQRNLPDFVDRPALSALLLEILELAREGLEKRGMEEGGFLAPLYPRAEKLLSPALEMVQGLEAGIPLENFIREYAML